MGAFLGAGLSGLFGGGSQFGQARDLQRALMGQQGAFAGEAGAAFGSSFPTLAQWARGATPGFGAQGLGAMLGAGTSAASSAAAAREQESADRALRLGNIGALGATENAAALQGARGGSEAVNNILARNAILQSQQQQMGLRGLEGIYGTGGRIGAQYGGEAAGLSEEQMRAAAERFGSFVNAFSKPLVGG